MKKIWSFLMIAFSFHNSGALAQTIIEWPNGWVSGYGSSSLGELNDSLLMVFHDFKDANQNTFTMVRYVNKNTMAISQTFLFERPANAAYSGALFFDDAPNIALVTYNDGNISPIGLFSFNPTGYDTLFYKVLIDKTLLITCNIIDNEFYTFRQTPHPDTTLIEVFDLAGNSLRSKYTWHKGVSDSNFVKLIETFQYGPFQHPTKSNTIVFGNFLNCRIIEINKQTLNVEYAMPFKFPGMDLTYSSKYIYGYELFNDRIACGGTVVRMIDIFTNPDIDFEMYFESRSWNGDSIVQTHFGEEGIKDRAYAFTYANGNYVLAGASPFNNPLWQATEYRETVIYKFDNNLVTDTLKLFGTKNHVPMQLHADDNGDLYMLSTYTDSWTTDSTFYVLTKIPAFVMQLPELSQTTKRIFVYPNPSSDFIMLSELPFMPQSIKLYSQNGALVQNITTDEEHINIAHLPAGMYVLVVTDKAGSASAVTFVKQ